VRDMELMLVMCDGNERTTEDDSADLLSGGCWAIRFSLHGVLCKAHVEYDGSETE
jgi:hypothetical protein